MRPAPPASNLDRWHRLLAAVLDGKLHQGVPEVAIDGIALVPSRSVEFADHAVRVDESAAVSCSCLDDRTRHSCAHRMAVAVRLWQAWISGLEYPPGDCDPYALAAEYRHAFCRALVERFLEPSPERVWARKLARFEAVRRRENEAGPRECPPLFADSMVRSAAAGGPRRVAL
jgi:hypothetical protein